jgi:hypothetical protein
MKTIVVGACGLLAAGHLVAQNYNMAIQQARRASAQNDAEQQQIQHATGGSGGGQGAAGGAPAPAPVDPALQATLSNISSLQIDFAAVVNATGDKADTKVSLMNNLSKAAQGTKASANSVKKLADDLLTALSGKTKLTAPQQTALAREIHALFNSSHLSSDQQEKLLAGVQKILTDAGAELDDAVNVVTDLKAVATETH